jgi:hypothetical protein
MERTARSARRFSRRLGWEGYEEYVSAISPIADAERTR